MDNSDATIYNNKSNLKNKKSSKKRSPTESQLCQNDFYEKYPSSAITDTVYTAGVSGMDFWELKPTSLNGGKDFSSGRVELQIRDRFDLTDFAEVAYQSKEVIAHQFGEETLKLHYALAAIAFRRPQAWKRKITVSASKLLADFGEDTKKRQYVSKNKRKNNTKTTRYISKDERLSQIAHHAYLLKRLEVWVKEWKVRQKGIFSVKMSNLWDISTIEQISQKSLHGDDRIIDIEITYSPGSWFDKFADREYLSEFGYLTGETLKLDTYREVMALRIAYFALFALQQNKSGYFQIETLLTKIGYAKEIEKARMDGRVAFNLKRSFDRGIQTLAKFEHPYTFIYDSNVPEWACLESKIKKPRYWFDKWLQCFGTLYQPEIKPEIKLEIKAKKNPESIPEANKEELSISKTTSSTDLSAFGQQIRKARKASKKSLRNMAKELHISPSRLSQIENGCYPHPVNTELKTKLLTHLGLEIKLNN